MVHLAAFLLLLRRHGAGDDPVVAVPVRLDDGLPLGVQVIVAPWREDVALRVARHLERVGAVAAPVATLG